MDAETLVAAFSSNFVLSGDAPSQFDSGPPKEQQYRIDRYPLDVMNLLENSTVPTDMFEAARVTDGLPCVVRAMSTDGLNPKQIDRLKAEAAAMKTMNHFGILRIIDWFAGEGSFVIVEGKTSDCIPLRTRLEQRVESAMGPFTEAEIIVLLAQVFMATHFLHSKRVAHRALSLSTVDARSDGLLVLRDFGYVDDTPPAQATMSLGGSAVLGTSFGSTIRSRVSIAGDPRLPGDDWLEMHWNSAPELRSGTGVSGNMVTDAAKLDMWDLGVMLFEMLALEQPFSKPDDDAPQSDHQETHRNTAELPSTISTEIKELMALLMVKEPENRAKPLELLARPIMRYALFALEKLLDEVNPPQGAAARADIKEIRLAMQPLLRKRAAPKMQDEKRDALDMEASVLMLDGTKWRPRVLSIQGGCLQVVSAFVSTPTSDSSATRITLDSILDVMLLPTPFAPDSTLGPLVLFAKDTPQLVVRFCKESERNEWHHMLSELTGLVGFK